MADRVLIMRKPRKKGLLDHEKRAIRSAIKVYLLFKRHGHPRWYHEGFLAGVKTMAECLPHGRRMQKIDRFNAWTARVLNPPPQKSRKK